MTSSRQPPPDAAEPFRRAGWTDQSRAGRDGADPIAGPVPSRRDTPVAQLLLGVMLLVVGTFIAYSPALGGGFLWDDDLYVSDNPVLRSPQALRRIWLSTDNPQYYPLVFTTFLIEWHLWGAEPTGYHIVNVVLHAANAVLLWLLWRRLRLPGAWVVGAVFALHPVHVESVAWITERKNVLAGLFYLLSISAFLRFEENGRRSSYAVALLLFVAALLSKTVTCTLPVALLLLGFLRRRRLQSRDVRRTIPFFVLGLAAGLLTRWYEAGTVGAVGPEWEIAAVERVLIAGRSLWFYLFKLLWPQHLIFTYPRWQIDTAALRQWWWPIAVLAAAVVCFRCRRTRAVGVVVGAAFFAATIAPALGLVDFYYMRFSFVADHFAYLASIGVIAAVVGIAAGCLPRRMAIGGGAAAVVVLGVLTWRQAHMYGDIETLWRSTIVANPRAWMAHYNLGLILARQGRHDEAVEQFEATLAVWPGHSDAHNNLGRIADLRGEHQRALEHYRAAVANDPRSARAWYNLGRSLARQSDFDGAYDAYARALAINARLTEAHNNLGNLLLRAGRLDEARTHFERAIELDPTNGPAHHNLGNVLVLRGEYEAAAWHYGRAIELDPGFADAHYRLGDLRRRLGLTEQAIEDYERALALDAAHLPARVALADALVAVNRQAEAANHLAKALRSRPSDAATRHNLSVVLQEQGRYAEAVAVLRRGMEVVPQAVGTVHDLARLLATCPDENVRDGDEALRLAQRVATMMDDDNPRALDTLAAAYAAAGRMDEAVATAERALALADDAGDRDLAKQIQRRLDQLREHVAD